MCTRQMFSYSSYHSVVISCARQFEAETDRGGGGGGGTTRAKLKLLE